MDTRTALIDAAKGLIWERGVAATSPNAVLAAADAGQGSLYHHFRGGKDDWAAAAIEALAADLSEETAELLNTDAPGLERLHAYLDKPRLAQAGCRLGRLAFDPYLAAHPALAAPIAFHFARTRVLLTAAIRDAVAARDLAPDLDADALAAGLLATVQGGYVLARGLGDDAAMTAALGAMHALLDRARPTTRRRQR